MNQITWSVVLVMGICPALSGQQAVSVVQHPDTSGPGWTDLFAADLSNAIQPQSKNGDIWTWQDGVLTASADQALWTRHKYGNCILDLEFRTESGSNNGVLVYCSDTDDWIPNSVEIQIADDFYKEWSDWPENWRCGAIFGHQAATKQMVKPAGEWNRCTIYCQGKTIRVVLNGEQINEIDISKWTSAQLNPDGSLIPEWLSRPMAELATQGHIGLQGKHGDAAIWFRNLRVKAL